MFLLTYLAGPVQAFWRSTGVSTKSTAVPSRLLHHNLRHRRSSATTLSTPSPFYQHGALGPEGCQKQMAPRCC